MVQERNSTNAITANYTRGAALSGSTSGASGIGGLLSRSTSAGHFYYHYDGSGNVVQLTTASQQVAAEYSYTAYGALLSSSGLQASQPYRYSTKEVHAASGLYDYGYRFYSPGLGKWINRDPIAERGGTNLYGFVANDPTDKVDVNGLVDWRGGLPKVSDDIIRWRDRNRGDDETIEFPIGDDGVPLARDKGPGNRWRMPPLDRECLVQALIKVGTPDDGTGYPELPEGDIGEDAGKILGWLVNCKQFFDAYNECLKNKGKRD